MVWHVKAIIYHLTGRRQTAFRQSGGIACYMRLCSSPEEKIVVCCIYACTHPSSDICHCD